MLLLKIQPGVTSVAHTKTLPGVTSDAHTKHNGGETICSCINTTVNDISCLYKLGMRSNAGT